MSDFLQSQAKEESDNKREKLSEKLKIIERGQDEKQTANKFNFMLDIAMGIPDSRGALRSFNFLKRCHSIKKSTEGVFMHYTDETHARWALNYLREGVQDYFKTKAIYTVFDGRLIDGLVTPDRKTGKVEALANSKIGLQNFR